jgi:hypothetical protein
MAGPYLPLLSKALDCNATCLSDCLVPSCLATTHDQYGIAEFEWIRSILERVEGNKVGFRGKQECDRKGSSSYPTQKDGDAN